MKHLRKHVVILHRYLQVPCTGNLYLNKLHKFSTQNLLQVSQQLNLVIWICSVVQEIFESEIQSVILIYVSMQVSQQLKVTIWICWGWKPVIPIGIYTKSYARFAAVANFHLNFSNVTSCCKSTELNLLTSGLNSRMRRGKLVWNKLIPRKTQKIESGKCVFCHISMLLAMRKLLEGLASIYLCVFAIQSSFQLFIWQPPESI